MLWRQLIKQTRDGQTRGDRDLDAGEITATTNYTYELGTESNGTKAIYLKMNGTGNAILGQDISCTRLALVQHCSGRFPARRLHFSCRTPARLLHIDGIFTAHGRPHWVAAIRQFFSNMSKSCIGVHGAVPRDKVTTKSRKRFGFVADGRLHGAGGRFCGADGRWRWCFYTRCIVFCILPLYCFDTPAIVFV